MKIGIGSVQFGMDYGVLNQGAVPIDEVREILETAQKSGIDLLDTAASYGNAEEVLGKTANSHFRVVTKFILSAETPTVETSLARSLQRLCRQSCYGLMAHRASDLLGTEGDSVLRQMLSLKEAGRVQKIGLSAYEAWEVEEVLKKAPIDLIQVPLNILDQRLIQDGSLERFKERGIEVHVRSVFLQGILLTEPASLPTHFDSAKPLLNQYHEARRRAGFSPIEAALGFVAEVANPDISVCGVNSRSHLEELLRARTKIFTADWRRFACDSKAILNPSLWMGPAKLNSPLVN